jgi:hypothetical protein
MSKALLLGTDPFGHSLCEGPGTNGPEYHTFGGHGAWAVLPSLQSTLPPQEALQESYGVWARGCTQPF